MSHIYFNILTFEILKMSHICFNILTFERQMIGDFKTLHSLQ